MHSETGFPNSHQLQSYVASKSRLKLAARAVLSADAGLLVTFIHRVSKNVLFLACYNFDTHEWILVFIGRTVTVTDEVGNHKTLYCATSNNLCFCTTWKNGET